MRSRAYLEVDLKLFAKNLSQLTKQYPNSKTLLMVKANAYGHGDKQIVKEAIEQGVCDFGLATVQEAIKLRETFTQRSIRFYIFSETELDDLNTWKKDYLNLDLIPVIENYDQLARILPDTAFDSMPIVLKVNIGMNRFGFNQEEFEQSCELLKQHNKSIFHLMGHLPCASDVKKIEVTNKQIESFNDFKTMAVSLGINVNHSSVCNSAAIERGMAIGYDFDYIRPGLIAYGAIGTRDNPSGWKGKIISSLKAKPLKIFTIEKDQEFGYGLTKSPRDGVVVILPLGYADGLTQNYSNIEFRWGEMTGQMIGFANMDISYILFDKVCESTNWIEVWGNDPYEFVHLAKKVKMIPYQVLCQISSRVPRVYKMR